MTDLMDTASQDTLISRLETATEGSRELDNTIDIAVRGNPDWKRAKNSPLVPHYTTSIDAALTLVPEGWSWFVGWTRVHNLGSAQLLNARATPSEYRDRAATPALALCIAALKSRQHG